MDIIYTSVPTMTDLHHSDAFYRGIMGPVRSGKSTGCSWELWRRACQQEPQRDDVRHTRFGVIRNTYRELLDTTVKTWLDWFPEASVGPFNQHNMTHKMRWKDVECEVLFRALDRPGDISKLLSLELTGGWVNEAREVPKGVIDTLGDRVGQYPAKKDGGCTWEGVILDTNPPDDDHWWYEMAEDGVYDGVPIDPEAWEFFRQPGGIIEVDGKFIANPEAENIENLNQGYGYYLKRLPGKKKSYIRVYYGAQYGYVQDGKPVHEEYVESTHCAKEAIRPVSGLPIVIGLDFGLTPAAAFLQRQASGQWVMFDELTTEHIGVKRFTKELLLPLLNGIYRGFTFEDHTWGDPSGSDEAQSDQTTCFQMLDVEGVKARPAPSNDPTLRRESLSAPLMRMVDGRPGFMISPTCKVAKKGLAGGYCYKRIQVAGDEKYRNVPDKNKYSHIVEALEYGLMGEGEGKMLIHRPIKKKDVRQEPGRPGGWMG